MMSAGARRAAIQPCALLATVSFILLAGCRVLGAPIPPEDVGAAPVVERQLRRKGC